MTRYNVPITRDCTETTIVDVHADSPEEARDKALAEASASPEDFEWTTDDCSGGQSVPYFAGGDDLDAIDEGCATCREQIETRESPCDECGKIDADDRPDEIDCGQCEGTGTLQEGASGAGEPCPVCDGSGTIEEEQ